MITIRSRNGYQVYGSDPNDGYIPSTVKNPFRKYVQVVDRQLPDAAIASTLNAIINVLGTEDYFRQDEWHCGEKGVVNMTLPANTMLKVDRIYIRQGAGEYDSITFTVDDCPLPEIKPKKIKGGRRAGILRFWAKLDDVNTIKCNIL
jgi:hypothetical protein